MRLSVSRPASLSLSLSPLRLFLHSQHTHSHTVSSGPNLDMPTSAVPASNGEPNTPPAGWPDNVGIVGMEIYFPAQFVDQVVHFSYREANHSLNHFKDYLF